MNLWVKRLHMYAGLLTFSALLVYGAAGLLATFHAAPEKRERAAPAVRDHAFAPPPGLTDLQIAEHVYATLKPPLAAPVPNFAVRRNRDNDLALDFYSVNGVQRAVVKEKDGLIRVETTRNGFWQYLDNLHSTTMGARTPHLRARLWKYYNEFAMWCLIGMTLSGVYLWLASRPRFRAAQACFAGGCALFVALYIAVR